MSASGNTVGGTQPGARNVISGNLKNGIEIQDNANGNVILGNYIGTDSVGSASVRNEDDGVDINSSSNNTIGGNSAAAANVISGNKSDGIEIAADGSRFSSNAANNVVQGNLLGTNPTGTTAIGNDGAGVRIVDNFGTTFATSNTVGGTLAGERNIISGNFGYGVLIQGSRANANVVQGNYIGTNASGAGALGNGTPGLIPSGSGVRIQANNNIIGGTGAGAGNVISGNVVHGIDVTASGTVVQGNLIGTNATGSAAVGNGGNGINLLSDLLASATNNVIGGAFAAARNVISGNGVRGIETQGVATSGNTIRGNYIGTDLGGTLAVPNTGQGVKLSAGANNSVGGLGAGEANVIAFNGSDGVVVGTPTTTATGNPIRGNSIHSNGELAIDLVPAGTTANDPGDLDVGPNGLQNFPVIATASPDGPTATRITGSLNSTPLGAFAIDFYADGAADPSGYGEGRVYLDSTTVNADASGNAIFDVVLPVTVTTGNFVSATATSASGDTSEMSLAAIVSATVTINGDAGGPLDDVFRLVRSGADLLVFVNSDVSPAYTMAFAGAPSIVVSGLEGNDTLVLDYSGGEVASTSGVSFNGGNGAADRVRVIGAFGADVFSLSAGTIGHGGGGSMSFGTVELLELRTGAFTFDTSADGLALEVGGGAGAATLTLDSSQSLGGLGLLDGASAVLTAGGDKLIVTPSLSFAGGASPTATLDLNDGDLIVRDAGPGGAAALGAQIVSARAGGAWTGHGLSSSAARVANPQTTTLGALLGAEFIGATGTTTFEGAEVGADDVLVKYTYLGDTDFNGVVDFDDYVRTDLGFNSVLSGWLNGDFDLNGVVEFDDFVFLDFAFNTGGPVL